MRNPKSSQSIMDTPQETTDCPEFCSDPKILINTVEASIARGLPSFDESEMLYELVENEHLPFYCAWKLVNCNVNRYLLMLTLLERRDATPEALEAYFLKFNNGCFPGQSTDGYEEIDSWETIAIHPNTPLTVRITIARNGRIGAVQKAIGSRILPESVLLELATRKDPIIRESVAKVLGNWNLLHLLSRDYEMSVAVAAAKTLNDESVWLEVLDRLPGDTPELAKVILESAEKLKDGPIKEAMKNAALLCQEQSTPKH